MNQISATIPAPAPFKVIGEEQDDDDDEGGDNQDKGNEKEKEVQQNEATPKQKQTAALKASKLKKTPIKTKCPKSKAQNLGLNYKPNEYQKKYREFYRRCREEGKDHKESLMLWNDSSEKQELLAGMSLSEQKRRRFVKS